MMSRSGPLIGSRVAGETKALGYALNKITFVPGGDGYRFSLEQVFRICMPGNKANISFDERFLVTHHYLTREDLRLRPASSRSSRTSAPTAGCTSSSATQTRRRSRSSPATRPFAPSSPIHFERRAGPREYSGDRSLGASILRGMVADMRKPLEPASPSCASYGRSITRSARRRSSCTTAWVSPHSGACSLRFVGKYPQITAGDLAAILHVEKSTLSLALKRLEERGLVARHRDAADARKAPIVLTAAGRAFDRPAMGTVERAVQRALRATKPRDLEVVRSFLQRLVLLLERGESPRVSRRRK